MNYKVILTRDVPKGKEKEVIDLIATLRASVSKHPGFISSELLRNADNPSKFLAISTWRSFEDWEDYANSEERKMLQAKIDAIEGCITVVERYQHPDAWENVPRPEAVL